MKSTNNLLLGSYFTYRSHKNVTTRMYGPKNNYQKLQIKNLPINYETWIVSPNSIYVPHLMLQ